MQIEQMVRELSQLRYLNREIAADKKRLKELEAYAEGTTQKITGMPFVEGITDKVGDCAARMADIRKLIESKIERCEREYYRLLNFIEGIEDSVLRQIFMYRYVNGLTWQQVAYHIGGYDESYPRITHNRYLAKLSENPERKII